MHTGPGIIPALFCYLIMDRVYSIGDSLNELPFLFAVDRPVLVKKESGRHDARIDIPGLAQTEGIGPAGWNEAVMRLISE